MVKGEGGDPASASGPFSQSFVSTGLPGVTLAKPGYAKPQTADASVTQNSGVQKNDDPLKGVDDSVNGLSKAVNTAQKDESAVDPTNTFWGFSVGGLLLEVLT